MIERMKDTDEKFMKFIKSVAKDVRKGYWLSRKPPKYVKKAQDSKDFLEKCRDRGLRISYEETFLRNYWYPYQKRKVKRNDK